MKRLVALLAAMCMLGFAFVAVSPAAEAEAFSYGRGRVTHDRKSERAYIITATKYNGRGNKDGVARGHRLPESAGKIRSVYLPKGCTLLTNGWAFQTAWTKADWVNIGKVPFVTVKLKMDCGWIKKVTG